jgi:hypothetical protein
MGCKTHAEIFFLLSTCSHTIGWQLFFGALVDCEEFCEKVSLRTFSMTSFKIPSTFFFPIIVVVALSAKLRSESAKQSLAHLSVDEFITSWHKKTKEGKIPCQMTTVSLLLT